MDDKKRDGAYSLIGLDSKPKQWRAVATKALIKQENKLQSISRETRVSIALAITILGIIIKMALGV